MKPASFQRWSRLHFNTSVSALKWSRLHFDTLVSALKWSRLHFDGSTSVPNILSLTKRAAACVFLLQVYPYNLYNSNPNNPITCNVGWRQRSLVAIGPARALRVLLTMSSIEELYKKTVLVARAAQQASTEGAFQVSVISLSGRWCATKSLGSVHNTLPHFELLSSIPTGLLGLLGFSYWVLRVTY